MSNAPCVRDVRNGAAINIPGDTIEPSELDWETMKTDGELVMGICSIRKTAKRRFVSFAFFGRNGQQLQLTIGEEDTSALRAKS